MKLHHPRAALALLQLTATMVAAAAAEDSLALTEDSVIAPDHQHQRRLQNIDCDDTEFLHLCIQAESYDDKIIEFCCLS